MTPEQKEILMSARLTLCMLTDDPLGPYRYNPMTESYKRVMDIIAEIEAMIQEANNESK